MTLVLASASPRRQELLGSIGVEFTVVAADIDESRHGDESPSDYVARIAEAKALAVVERMDHGMSPDVVVLAADTTVDVDGEVLGKPVDDEDARRMLRLLSGRTHQTHTAVFGWTLTEAHPVTVTTDVTFAALSESGIEWYLSTGEHRDKAGSYGLQGAAGALVHRIEGSHSNVIGLPLAETIGVLRACGIAVLGSSAGITSR